MMNRDKMHAPDVLLTICDGINVIDRVTTGRCNHDFFRGGLKVKINGRWEEHAHEDVFDLDIIQGLMLKSFLHSN